MPELDPEEAIAKQDTFRKVYLGEISDPIYPPHPAPPEIQEDELTQAALSDTDIEPLPSHRPTPWRALFLIAIAVAALAYVFGRR